MTDPFEIFLVKKDSDLYFNGWPSRRAHDPESDCWTSNPKRARIYRNIGGARSIITGYLKLFPGRTLPYIFKISAPDGIVIDDSERAISSRAEAKLKVLNNRLSANRIKLYGLASQRKQKYDDLLKQEEN